jgi:electron transport complex protein RnfG
LLDTFNKKMPENIRSILTLTLICLLTAFLLTGVYILTRPRILEQKVKDEQAALSAVLPEAGSFEPVVRKGEIVYFQAYSAGGEKRTIGYAFVARAQGYSSVIETMAAMDTQGRITGIRILSQNETPGLGAKISEVLVNKTLWQAIKEFFTPGHGPLEFPAQPWFCGQFKGKMVEDLVVVKDTTEKNIQAITGATISSEALTDSVREKAKEILEYERR